MSNSTIGVHFLRPRLSEAVLDGIDVCPRGVPTVEELQKKSCTPTVQALSSWTTFDNKSNEVTSLRRSSDDLPYSNR